MTSQELALRDAVNGTIAQLRSDALAEQAALAVPEGVSPQRILRAAATAVLDNPKLAAENLRPHLIKATLKSAQDGLLPDGREAAFVIFGGKEPSIAYMPMVGGLRKIAAECGIAIRTGIVHENDTFEPDYDNGRAGWTRARLGAERGQIIGAFAEAQHRDGRRWLEVMDVNEINRVRNVSRAKDSGPWKDWWDRMAEKTVARRLFKSLPLDPNDAERIHRVLAASDLDGEQAIDTLYGDRPDAPPAIPAVARAGEAAPQSASPPPNVNLETGEIIEEKPPLADDDIPFGDETPAVPFDGEEPPEEVEGEIVDEDAPTFSAGRYEGKTIAEIYELGDKGMSYLRWALKNWTTDPLASALKAFAQEHPEITE